MILVDTDVLIANLRGVSAARDWLKDTRIGSGQLSISVVTTAELVGGMRSAERSDVLRLLGSLRSLVVSEMVAHRAGELRRTYRRSHAAIGLADYFVAATALVHGLDLATLNTKHFPMFEDLRAPFQA